MFCVAAAVAALLLAPLLAPAVHVTLLNYIGLYSLVALGLVLLTGVAGQTSFGQAAFVGLAPTPPAWWCHPIRHVAMDHAVHCHRHHAGDWLC